MCVREDCVVWYVRGHGKIDRVLSPRVCQCVANTTASASASAAAEEARLVLTLHGIARALRHRGRQLALLNFAHQIKENFLHVLLRLGRRLDVGHAPGARQLLGLVLRHTALTLLQVGLVAHQHEGHVLVVLHAQNLFAVEMICFSLCCPTNVSITQTNRNSLTAE